MNLFTTFKQSVYGPGLYKSVVSGSKSLTFSFKYFFKLLVVITIIMWLVASVFFGGLLYFGGKVIAPELVKQFPADLTLTVRNGQVFTNVIEPYRIPLPANKEVSKTLADKSTVKNLVVIDTSSDASLENFQQANTVAYVTKKAVMYADEKGKISIVTLEKVPDLQINQATIQTWYPKVETFFKGAFAVLIVFLLPAMFVGLSLYYLVYLLVASLLVWGLMYIMNVKGTYSKAYQVSLHAVTLPLVVGLFGMFLPVIKFPFLATIVLLAVVGINLKK